MPCASYEGDLFQGEVQHAIVLRSVLGKFDEFLARAVPCPAVLSEFVHDVVSEAFYSPLDREREGVDEQMAVALGVIGLIRTVFGSHALLKLCAPRVHIIDDFGEGGSRDFWKVNDACG
jgi:hypothetical protein